MTTRQEYACRIYKERLLGERVVLMPANNEAGLKKGDAVRVSAGDWSQIALVRLDDSPGIAPGNRNNLQSSKWDGTPGMGSYGKISGWSYKWDVLRRSKKANAGLLLMLVGLALAYGNAALQKDGTMQWNLGGWRWLIFAGTFLVALTTWLRDTWL